MSGRFTVETVFKGTDQTSSVLGTISAKTKAFQKALSGPSNFVDKGIAGAKQLAAATAFAGASAVGLGFAFKEAIDPGAAFDQQMSAVGAVSLMTRDQVSDLEKEARKLGKTTKFSATEVAGGMELMGKAGFDNAQIIQGIAPLLNAAAAEGMAFEETASVVSNVMKGMNLQMSETGRVADVLTLASARTNSSISSLGESMAIVAPTARQLKVPFEDATAAVAMLQDQGLDASVAGSAVATMLTNLSKPPKEIAAKMKAMGVSFQDAHGDMLPFREVIGQLAKAGTKAGGNMAQIAFFADLVGMRGQKAALNLKDIGPALAKLTTDLNEATGSAAKMAGLKMDNFLGDVTLLGNQVKDLGIDFFDIVKGPLREVAQAGREWLSVNQDTLKEDVAGWVGGVADKVVDLSKNIGLGIAMADNFKDGLFDAFSDSTVLSRFGDILHGLFGTSDKNGPRMQAYELGRTIGEVTKDFIIFTAVTKSAAGAVWAFENATKIARAGKWLWDLGSAAFNAAKALKAVNEVGPSNIIQLSNALNGVGGGFGSAAANASSFIGLRAGLNGIFSSIIAQAGLAALAIGAVVAAGYQANELANVSGGWQGVGEGTATGVAGFFGSGTKSWGVNGFLEGYNQGVDSFQNEEAARNYRGDKEKWGAGSAASAAEMLTGLGRGSGRTADDYAGAFGFGAGITAPRPADQAPSAPMAPVVSTRDRGSDEAAKSNAALKASIDQLAAKFGAGGPTVTLKLPPGVAAETSGAPGVVVTQTGGF